MNRILPVFFGVLRAVRACLWPGAACRFEPSCSRYAEDAIRCYGIARSAALTLRRLLRCHPFNPGGHDPVPQTHG